MRAASGRANHTDGVTDVGPHGAGIAGRSWADLLLFGVTAAELGVLLLLTPTFTIADWIYVSQHLLVLGLALTRPPPEIQDRSPLSNAAVVVAYAYPYAQVLYLRGVPGEPGSADGALALVT